MTPPGAPEDEAAVLGMLVGASVQFVVVGEPLGERALRLVVSRHPTNLDALGKALARMGAALRSAGAPDAGAPDAARDTAAGTEGSSVRRIGDPFGTVSVTAGGVDLDLMFGGPHHSLYAETLATATDREIAGVQVRWAEAPAAVAPSGRGTGGVLGRRLLSIAEGLAHLVEREDGPSAGGGDPDS